MLEKCTWSCPSATFMCRRNSSNLRSACVCRESSAGLAKPWSRGVIGKYVISNGMRISSLERRAVLLETKEYVAHHGHEFTHADASLDKKCFDLISQETRPRRPRAAGKNQQTPKGTSNATVTSSQRTWDYYTGTSVVLKRLPALKEFSPRQAGPGSTLPSLKVYLEVYLKVYLQSDSSPRLGIRDLELATCLNADISLNFAF